MDKGKLLLVMPFALMLSPVAALVTLSVSAGSASAAPALPIPVSVPVNSCQLDPEISALPGADQLCALK